MARQWESPRVKRDREERERYRKEHDLRLEPEWRPNSDYENDRTRMSRNERELLFREIYDSNGDPEVVSRALSSLKEDYDITDSVLDEYGETYDRLYDQYGRLREQNADMFYRTTFGEVKESQSEDIEMDDDSEDMSYESLFKEREGD